MRIRRVARDLLVVAAVLCTAAAPSWWSQRGVTISGGPKADYAPVTQGQVKWMATQAAAELNEHLPGGCGAEVQGQIDAFFNAENDLSVAVGQLKEIARPFYDRLIAAGYTTVYPWTTETSDDVDLALATVGQLKNLFDFDLTTDTDEDVLPDWWEMYRFGNLTETTGDDDPDGDGVLNGEEFHAGTSPTAPDTDEDGMPDQWELQNGLNPLVNDAEEDTDSDTLSNRNEYLAHTNPQSPDTDGDGMGDAWEVQYAATILLDEHFDDGKKETGWDDPANWSVYEGRYRKSGFGDPSDSNCFNQASSSRFSFGANTYSEFVVEASCMAGWPTSSWSAIESQQLCVALDTAMRDAEGVLRTRRMGVWEKGVCQTVAGQSMPSEGKTSLFFDYVAPETSFRPYAAQTQVTGVKDLYNGSGSYRLRIAVCRGRLTAYGRHDTNAWVRLGDQPFENSRLESIALSAGQVANPAWFDDVLVITPGMRPTVPDADGDWDADGLSNLEESQHGTSPINPDSDDDGVPDGWEVAHGFDPLEQTDTDGDGMADEWETYWFGDLSQTATGDFENDDLSNLAEFHHRTDPTRVDTDADGIFDGMEVQNGSDPGVAQTIFEFALPQGAAASGYWVTIRVEDGDGYGDDGWDVTHGVWDEIRAQPLRLAYCRGKAPGTVVPYNFFFPFAGTGSSVEFGLRWVDCGQNHGTDEYKVTFSPGPGEDPNAPIPWVAHPNNSDLEASLDWTGNDDIPPSTRGISWTFTMIGPPDLDGIEPNGGVVSEGREETPGVLLVSGQTKLVIFADISDDKTLMLTWENPSGSKTLKVDGQGSGMTLLASACSPSKVLTVTTEGTWQPSDKVMVKLSYCSPTQKDLDQVLLRMSLPTADIVSSATEHFLAVNEEGPKKSVNVTTVLAPSTEYGLFKLQILDASGNVKRVLPSSSGEELSGGTHVYAWDGKDESGQTVSPGYYKARATWEVSGCSPYPSDDEYPITAVSMNLWPDMNRDGVLSLPQDDDSAEETAPGLIFGLNRDDDDADKIRDDLDGQNQNGTSDADDANDMENDLATVCPVMAPTSLGQGFVRLKVEPAGKIRVWKSATKRKKNLLIDTTGAERELPLSSGCTLANVLNRLYVEGVEGSDDGGVKMTLTYENPKNTVISKDILTMTSLRVDLVPNYDRDSDIDEDDRAQVWNGKKFRFWINDDDDSGYEGGSDIPGKGTADWNNSKVDGERDLVDFFPVWMDLEQSLRLMPAAQHTYVVKHADKALGGFFVASPLGMEADAYLRSASFALGIKQQESCTFTSAGRSVPDDYITAVSSPPGRGFVLLEGRCATKNPLVLEIRRKDNNAVVAKGELPLRLDGVEKMFRNKNLRGVSGGTGGSSDRFVGQGEQPDNYPDGLCSTKHLVFVHGYAPNNWPSMRGWTVEMFKRFWWSGSKAKFHAIEWQSDQGDGAAYQINVNNAFKTAASLSQYVNGLSGAKSDKVVVVHSLGNIVVSSAIADRNMEVGNYFLVNAAVACEAYDRIAPEDSRMIPKEWSNETFDYPRNVWATEWHTLFPGKSREKLTWRNRFATVLGKTTAWQFYSTGDEVYELGEIERVLQGVWYYNWRFIVPLPQTDFARYCWQKQEKFKGTLYWSPLNLISDFGMTRHAGWGFDSTLVVEEPGKSYCVIPTYTPDQARSLSAQTLRTAPVFRHYPGYLVGTAELTSQQINELLAMGFPALTPSAGNTSVAVFTPPGEPTRSFNLDTPPFKPNGWPREYMPDPNHARRWLHNDVRAMAYVYTYKVLDAIAEKGDLQ